MLQKAAKWCTPLKQALDTWGELRFDYAWKDTADFVATPTVST